MPYIIITRPRYARAGREPEAAIRRAVATLEEARTEVTRLALRPALLAENYDDLRVQFDDLRESGGTIGPLPDGTVIEVRPVSLTELSLLAGLTMTPELHRALRDDSAAAILAAFNQERNA